MRKVVIYSVEHHPFWLFPSWLAEELASTFPQFTFVLSHGEPPLEELIEDAEVLITGRMTPELLARARKLRWIHSPYAGVGNMLFREMVESPVIITNSKGVNAEAVALHALSLSLALLRGLHLACSFKRQRLFDHPGFISRFIPLETELVKVGIFGFGQIGRRLASKFMALGFETYCLRRRKAQTPCHRTYTMEELDEFLKRVDLLVLAAPRTSQTTGLFNYERLSLVGGFLVNVARGKLVVEQDLIRALREGRLKGAALDVFEKEPLPPESPLWDMDNVIITPHVAGASPLFWKKMKELLMEQFRRYLKGEALLNVVDKKAGY